MAILEPSNPSILSSTKLPSASTIDGKYDFAELDEVSLAYAVTIHKSQASEFPAAVIPITTQHYVLLQRNLIYTGLTRGKKLVVLIGQKKALGMADRNDGTQRRYFGAAGTADSLIAEPECPK